MADAGLPTTPLRPVLQAPAPQPTPAQPAQQIQQVHLPQLNG